MVVLQKDTQHELILLFLFFRFYYFLYLFSSRNKCGYILKGIIFRRFVHNFIFPYKCVLLDSENIINQHKALHSVRHSKAVNLRVIYIWKLAYFIIQFCRKVQPFRYCEHIKPWIFFCGLYASLSQYYMLILSFLSLVRSFTFAIIQLYSDHAFKRKPLFYLRQGIVYVHTYTPRSITSNKCNFTVTAWVKNESLNSSKKLKSLEVSILMSFETLLFPSFWDFHFYAASNKQCILPYIL